MFAVHLDVWWCLWHCRLGGQWSTLFKAVNHMFYSRWWFQEDSSACICRSIAATRREELSNLLSQKAWDQRCFQTDLYGVAPVAVLEVLGQQLRPNCTCKNVRFTAVHQSSVFFFLMSQSWRKASPESLAAPAPSSRMPQWRWLPCTLSSSLKIAALRMSHPQTLRYSTGLKTKGLGSALDSRIEWDELLHWKSWKLRN